MIDQAKKPETGPETKGQINTTGWHRPNVMDLDPPNCILVDVPGDYRANIIVIRYPKVTQSKGGIEIPSPSHKSPACLAFVIKSSTYPIQRGDTVLAPEHIFTLDMILGKQVAYALDVRDVVLLYPDPKNPLEKRQPPKGQDDEQEEENTSS